MDLVVAAFEAHPAGFLDGLLAAMLGEVGGLLGETVLTLVVGIYWMTARDEAVTFGTSLFSIGRRARMKEIITEIESSLGTYVRGVLTVAFVVGLANFAILSLFRVPNAVTLAFIMGITTALPASRAAIERALARLAGEVLILGETSGERERNLTLLSQLFGRVAAFIDLHRKEVERLELHPVALLVGGGAEIREAAVEVTDAFVRELA